MAAVACRARRSAALAAAITTLLLFSNTTAASAAAAGLPRTPKFSSARPEECFAGGDVCKSGMSSNAALMQVNSEQLKVPGKGLYHVSAAVLAQSDDESHETSYESGRSSASMSHDSVDGVNASTPPSANLHEPLLDEDYIHDTNNPLDNFDNNGEEERGNKSTGNGDSNQGSDSVGDTTGDGKSPLTAASANANGGGESIVCKTRFDPRAVASGYVTAEPGTPCIFGLDARDEGKHCVADTDYGSFGWCFTDEDRRSFGSCSPECPMFGPHGILQKKIEVMNKAVAEILDKVNQVEPCDSQGGDAKGGDDKKKSKHMKK